MILAMSEILTFNFLAIGMIYNMVYFQETHQSMSDRGHAKVELLKR